MGVFEVKPGIGVGPVTFGQTPAEVQAALAEPQRYEDWMGGNLNDSLLFQGLILEFDVDGDYGPPPHSRLVMATLEGRVGTHLFGRPAGEWTRGDLLAYLRAQGHDPDREHFNKLSVDSLGLSTAFDWKERLHNIEVWEPEYMLRLNTRWRFPENDEHSPPTR